VGPDDSVASAELADVKDSFQASFHDAWYLGEIQQVTVLALLLHTDRDEILHELRLS
jgi:hypothetical protein